MLETILAASAGQRCTIVYCSHQIDEIERLADNLILLDAGRLLSSTAPDEFRARVWARNGKPPRIGVTGNSYGGYAALLAMSYFAGAYDAGVAEAGPANLVTFLQTTAARRRSMRAGEFGDPEQDKDALTKLSPLTYADRVRSPLLIVQGANDPRVPVTEAIAMYDALNKRGVPVNLIVFADEGHAAAHRNNRALAFGHRLAFFDKHLK